VLRTLEPNTEGTLPQAGLRHRCDHLGIPQGGPLRSLHRNDQPPGKVSTTGKRWEGRTHGGKNDSRTTGKAGLV
jgi:hypothetical protein